MTFAVLKPYQAIPIQDNGDLLIPIPQDQIRVITPHPYETLGAPYGDRSPFYLRSQVVERLLQAQQYLDLAPRPLHLQGQILFLEIFDAYRPVAVQQFMVDYTFGELVQGKGLNVATLLPQQRQDIQDQVHQFWAVPSLDPALPPPHSTGGAVDLTIVTAAGMALDMGSPIDECSSRSYPDHFATAAAEPEIHYHQNRLLLRHAMIRAGFANHPKEWWHFSYGDQLWAWISGQDSTVNNQPTAACYGGVS